MQQKPAKIQVYLRAGSIVMIPPNFGAQKGSVPMMRIRQYDDQHNEIDNYI